MSVYECMFSKYVGIATAPHRFFLFCDTLNVSEGAKVRRISPGHVHDAVTLTGEK
jgi:hypothetical protein